jgi:hypothetical protein
MFIGMLDPWRRGIKCGAKPLLARVVYGKVNLQLGIGINCALMHVHKRRIAGANLTIY